MSRATAKLDLYEMETEISSKFQKLMEPQRSFRGIQGAISKINPQLLKNLIDSGTASAEGNREEHLFPSQSTSTGNQSFVSTLPVLNLILRPTSEISQENAPLTIFYNGTVSVFNVPCDKAERIMKLAETESSDLKLVVSSSQGAQVLDNLKGDMPIFRRKSLQRFLQKRKERLTSVSPYESVGTCGGREDKDSVRA
ncbi:protein TIFY 9-like [Telopea speciosissima]|uniref:protein TIFY 9-like n=1 Tax=Telopea speciosissima TaxID=54955 RepID=UPI001CC37366|nr:protein TIFY 9-like [Telopea speciosissima]